MTQVTTGASRMIQSTAWRASRATTPPSGAMQRSSRRRASDTGAQTLGHCSVPSRTRACTRPQGSSVAPIS